MSCTENIYTVKGRYVLYWEDMRFTENKCAVRRIYYCTDKICFVL